MTGRWPDGVDRADRRRYLWQHRQQGAATEPIVGKPIRQPRKTHSGNRRVLDDPEVVEPESGCGTYNQSRADGARENPGLAAATAGIGDRDMPVEHVGTFGPTVTFEISG